MATPTSQKGVIGLFNDSFPPVYDGVTLTVLNYARWLNAYGYRPCVVTPRTGHEPPHPHYDLYSYFSLPILSRRPYRYGYPKADPRIWRTMRRVPFTLVHAHCPFSSGRLALYAARHHDIPLVATFHSKYRTDLEHSLPRWLADRIMRRVMEFFNAADEVWIPQAAVEETVRSYGYRGRLTVVENGIDIPLSDPDATKAFKQESRRLLGLDPERLHLLFVGQHILPKGVDVIIRAAALLRDLPVDVTFIGTGYAEPEMHRLIDELSLTSTVRMLGPVEDRMLIKRHYAAADLFLFPSFYDNAPLVVREAAAMGTPAILPSGSTASEVITDGVNGFLSERTPEGYAAVIRHLCSDCGAIDKAARGAASTLTRQWADVLREVDARYSEIISRHGRK